ncbi:MAG: ribosome biogenesis GTP-binding protein YihA/YsxC [Deltaproteobacteria bacterium]|nr:ribosome biogenesis GTP-binding protein YihA/YsxC [Deltaproteobacteria bacterium]
MGGPAEAIFVAGAARLDRLPPPRLPEVAFAGRSNVGKSSLLNRLTRRRSLARVSKTPGRTQQINFFAIDARLLFVDLPGYGFAKVPLAVKDAWRGLVEGYLTADRPLRGVCVLVDIRRGLLPDDQQLLDFLAAHDIAAQIVATKIDKLTRGARAGALRAIGADVIGVSAETGDGISELWRVIDAWGKKKNGTTDEHR